jgi:hypothetical protein
MGDATYSTAAGSASPRPVATRAAQAVLRCAVHVVQGTDGNPARKEYVRLCVHTYIHSTNHSSRARRQLGILVSDRVMLAGPSPTGCCPHVVEIFAEKLGHRHRIPRRCVAHLTASGQRPAPTVPPARICWMYVTECMCARRAAGPFQPWPAAPAGSEFDIRLLGTHGLQHSETGRAYGGPPGPPWPRPASCRVPRQTKDKLLPSPVAADARQ